MSRDSETTIYFFGDNHRTPREDVRDRLYSVIPDEADVLVMEHAVKSDSGKESSQWVILKNPSLILSQLIVVWYQKWKRKSSNRMTDGSEISVAEEVANELGLDVEYTDLTGRQRIHRQPLYLTLVSWMAFLSGLFIWLVHPLLLMVAFILVLSTGLLSLKVFQRIRNNQMAADLRDLSQEYSEIVFFTGDSHVDPIKNRLREDLELVEKPRSRL